jgi:hypothetical protein
MDILECPTLKQALELGLTAAIPKRQHNNKSRSTSTKLSQRAFQCNKMHIVLLCSLGKSWIYIGILPSQETTTWVAALQVLIRTQKTLLFSPRISPLAIL